MPFYTLFTKCQTMGFLLLLQDLSIAPRSTKDQHNHGITYAAYEKNPKTKER